MSGHVPTLHSAHPVPTPKTTLRITKYQNFLWPRQWSCKNVIITFTPKWKSKTIAKGPANLVPKIHLFRIFVQLFITTNFALIGNFTLEVKFLVLCKSTVQKMVLLYPSLWLCGHNVIKIESFSIFGSVILEGFKVKYLHENGCWAWLDYVSKSFSK